MIDTKHIWRSYIKNLEGKIIETATGKKNTITSVTDAYLERKSSNGKLSKIKRSLFENVYQELLLKKVITRSLINIKHNKRCSSIVTVILAQIPGVILEKSPAIQLKVN